VRNRDRAGWRSGRRTKAAEAQQQKIVTTIERTDAKVIVQWIVPC
jgi:hypothetical protein